jgi:hypothetical protein
MVATTSGTTSFTLDVDEIIEQAFEPLGGQHITAGDSIKARRTLSLILIEMQNKGIPLNKIDFVTQALTQSTSEYNLDASYVDVLELNLKRDGVETPLLKYSLREFHQIPDKDDEGKPSVYTIERNRDTLQLKLWSTPENSTDTVEMMVSKKVEDIDAAYQRVDLPYRYLPLLTRWLAYELSLHRQGIDPQLRMELKENYKESLIDTFEEDRERTDLNITPSIPSGR